MPRGTVHARLFAVLLIVVFEQVPLSAADHEAAAPAASATHHRGDRFQNNYLDFEPKGVGDLLKWRLDAAREGLPRQEARVGVLGMAAQDLVADRHDGGQARGVRHRANIGVGDRNDGPGTMRRPTGAAMRAARARIYLPEET